jgi:hypothetical protein
MSRSKLAVLAAAAVSAIVAGTVLAATPASGAIAARGAHSGRAAPSAPYPGPELKLVPAQNSITAYGFPVKKGSKKDYVYVDPGIWMTSLGAALQFDVSRASYQTPVTLTQIIARSGHSPHTRLLPASMLDGWNGLKDMVRLTVRDRAGKLVGSTRFTVCPDAYDTERATPDSPDTSPYPQTGCYTADPFPLSQVWGIAKGWGIDPGTAQFTLTAGSTYKVTETITPRYVGWLHVPARDASASVTMTVVTGSGFKPAQSLSTALPALPAVPYLKNPPKSVRPDLVPLPAFGVSTTRNSGRDWLNFSATVWVGGNAPLDVEAFRSGGSPVMPAYQYFYRDGKVIGRVRAGTMGFDSAKGHTHWHFEQFAAYRLLGASGKLVVRSQKVGFCIAPTDAVNLLLSKAVWQPPFIGLSGQCGSTTALWVREMMPVGWGDTYQQFLAGQAFDITNVPNGTYYIEVIANPERLLRETSYQNDISLRSIIITGTKAHRHVRVPAWHGIDPEG